MTDPKKTAAQAELEKLKSDNWADFLFDPAIARKAADAGMESIARKAMDWKKARGVYPWEEPESVEDKKIAKGQEAWLRESGIDPEKTSNEFLGKIKEAVQRFEEKIADDA